MGASKATERVTIHNVAAGAGVAASTASQALNGRGQLRAETRQRAIAAADELSFQPDTFALSLLSDRSYSVGLLTSDRVGRFSVPVLAGVEDALGARRRVRDVLREAGLELAGGEALGGGETLGRDWSEAWVDRPPRSCCGAIRGVDAIVCGTDQLARGVMDTLRDHGRRVPDDVAVIGFDNWETLGMPDPAHLRRPRPRAARQARGPSCCSPRWRAGQSPGFSACPASSSSVSPPAPCPSHDARRRQSCQRSGRFGHDPPRRVQELAARGSTWPPQLRIARTGILR